MVTSKEGLSDGNNTDELHQKQNPGSGLHESKSNNEGSSLLMLPKELCGKLEQRESSQSADTDKDALQPHQGVSDISMVQNEVSHPEKTMLKQELTDLQQQRQCTGTQANVEGSSVSIIPKKESDDSQQRRSSDCGVYVSHANKEGSLLLVKPETESDNLLQKQNSGTEIHVLRPNQEESMLSAIPEKVSKILQERQGPNSRVPTLQFEEVSLNVSVRSEKVLEKLPLRRKLESGANLLNSGQEGSSAPKLSEKVSEDGYNWRKYGQKLVKGNEFIRSYYKCTYPNCLAKKQVERSHDGPITDINYLGKHEHPKRCHSPQVVNGGVLSMQARRQDEPALPIAQDKSSNDHDVTLHQIEPTETPRPSKVAASDDFVEVTVSPPNKVGDEVDDGDQYSKRQKKDLSNVDGTLVNKLNGESRFVVQTMSEVDYINDGYRWRKYGQKLVKGNPNPRSYYRCSNTGCPAKKHVERASHEPKLVITTYEGQHDHEVPPNRTITHSTAGANTSTEVIIGEPRSKPEENGAASLDVVVHIGAN